MILDKLSNARRYFGVHPLFKAGFNYLEQAVDRDFLIGRYQLAGRNLVAIVEEGEGRTHEHAPLEVHRRHIDIQYCFEGEEEIGWKAYEVCKDVRDPYDADRDIEFFSDVPDLWLPVRPDWFVILFPGEDAHAPLAGHGPVRKIVLKVEI